MDQGNPLACAIGSHTPAVSSSRMMNKKTEFLRYLLSSIKADYKSASESFRIANPKEQPGCSGFVIPN